MALERRLREESVGEVRFDAFARGRYATDASAYQIMPVGVVIPGSMEQAARALNLARSEKVPVLARGGGTSQSGQTVNEALVVDCSKRLNNVLSLDVEAARCKVEPGVVLDELNRRLKSHGLWFPVDVSTASRATIGGMAGNNACGGRSLRYGTMRDNVLSIDAVLADGSAAHFGSAQADLSDLAADDLRRVLFGDLLNIGAREAEEVAARFPAVQRRVGGYNLDALAAPGIQSDGRVNLAHLLVGSEGTLAFSTAIELKLSPLLGRRAVGVCHFGSFFEAMNAAQHIVALKPIAVELIDRTMLGLAAGIAIFRPTLAQFLRGDPEALLVVEFAENDQENRRRLSRLAQVISGSDGIARRRNGAAWSRCSIPRCKPRSPNCARPASTS
jgi:FAD/FMN-containing dehydrogenase